MRSRPSSWEMYDWEGVQHILRIGSTYVGWYSIRQRWRRRKPWPSKNRVLHVFGQFTELFCIKHIVGVGDVKYTSVYFTFRFSNVKFQAMNGVHYYVEWNPRFYALDCYRKSEYQFCGLSFCTANTATVMNTSAVNYWTPCVSSRRCCKQTNGYCLHQTFRKPH
jgi:hypothetical protein